MNRSVAIWGIFFSQDLLNTEQGILNREFVPQKRRAVTSSFNIPCSLFDILMTACIISRAAFLLSNKLFASVRIIFLCADTGATLHPDLLTKK